MRSLRTIVVAGMSAALMLALAACVSSSSSSNGTSAGGSVPAGVQTPATQSLSGKRGGVLTDIQTSDFEHLDPGQSYYQLDYQITSATQRGLYAYKPNTFTEVTPDMAEGP